MFIPLTTESIFFFFNDTATTEIYTLSLHDALPILVGDRDGHHDHLLQRHRLHLLSDRKSTRLNSSHGSISYAVFCLKKNKRFTSNKSTLINISKCLTIGRRK